MGSKDLDVIHIIGLWGSSLIGENQSGSQECSGKKYLLYKLLKLYKTQ